LEATVRPIASSEMIKTMREQCPMLSSISDSEFKDIIQWCPTIDQYSNVLATFNKIMHRLHRQITTGDTPLKIPFLVEPPQVCMLRYLAQERTTAIMKSVRSDRNAAPEGSKIPGRKWSKTNTIFRVRAVLDKYPMTGDNGRTLRVVIEDAEIWKAMQGPATDTDADADAMLEWVADAEMMREKYSSRSS
jgi:hypothetical protein